jgi:hypothetical protein
MSFLHIYFGQVPAAVARWFQRLPAWVLPDSG